MVRVSVRIKVRGRLRVCGTFGQGRYSVPNRDGTRFLIFVDRHPFSTTGQRSTDNRRYRSGPWG